MGNPAVLGWLYVRIKKTVSKTKWADSTLKTWLRGFRSEKLVRVKSRAQQVQEAFSQNRTVGHTESQGNRRLIEFSNSEELGLKFDGQLRL